MLGARQSFGRQAVPFGLLYAMLALLAGLSLLGAAVALMYLDGSVRSLSLSVLGGVFLSVIVVIGVFLLDRRRNRVTWRAAMALMADDQTPCFITSETGFVVAQNNSAVAKFGSQSGKSLAHILTSVSPTLTRSLERLETALLRDAHVSEAITTPRVSVALNGHRLGRGVFWRLDFEKITRAETAVVRSDPVEINEKIATEAAEEADIIFSRSFESLPVALLHLAADGRVLASNTLAQTLLDMPPDEDAHLSGLVKGLGRPVRDWLKDVVENRIPNRAEFVRARRREDDQFLQISLGQVADENGPSLIAVLHDATELKSLEQQFAQSQKMQAIGELAGGVAHDFNNLLTAITGHCDLLLMRHDEGDQDFADLVQISQNANRAASLVGQLLAFSRKQTLQLEMVDLRETMGELTHLLNRLVGEKIRLHLSHDPDLAPIRADRRQFDQIIVNLVVNARDAMSEGGDIHVTTRMEHLEAPLERDRAHVPAGDYVTIRVQDEGVGIPADRLGRIFEPFFTTKRTCEGTGLGLSMVYGIVKQSGGFVFVDSEEGQGAYFTVYCPAYDETTLPQEPDQPQLHSVLPKGIDGPIAEIPQPVSYQIAPHDLGADKRVILLVEDEAPVRAFASRALRLRGYHVLEADCAEQALETLRDHEIAVDLFVTDVVMPGMDGPTWVREARKARPDVKVVFVSGYAEDAFEKHSTEVPNSVFLPKPFSLSELTNTIQNQLH